MRWQIDDHERAAMAAVAQDTFKRDVIAHAKRKAVFTPKLSDHDYEKIADFMYARVEAFLNPYPNASYDSYVLMLLVYFIRGTEQVEGPDMQGTLRNERFGINTRVRVAYDLTKEFMKAGF